MRRFAAWSIAMTFSAEVFLDIFFFLSSHLFGEPVLKIEVEQERRENVWLRSLSNDRIFRTLSAIGERLFSNISIFFSVFFERTQGRKI